MRILEEALTFDDVLLVPAHSLVLPAEVSLATQLTREIRMNIPMASAAMDTVTEAKLAIALAQEGGIGMIHKNMSIEAQAADVLKVKKFESGIIKDPFTVTADTSVHDVIELTSLHNISGVPVVAGDNDLVGIVTSRDLRFETNHKQPVSQIMTPKDKLVTVNGNVATGEGALALVEAGADGVKVGIGPGSICTTRVVAGVGVPQITAVMNAAAALRNTGVPMIADGGIRYSGDVAKAIAAGAHCVMLGSMLAGTDEAPGEVILYQGRSYKTYRGMGSLGAMAKGSSDRYFQESENAVDKLVPEGIEGMVGHKGSITNILHQISGGIRASMGYVGCGTLDEMRTKPQFVRITGAGMKESHAHDVTITKEAPNYHS